MTRHINRTKIFRIALEHADTIYPGYRNVIASLGMCHWIYSAYRAGLLTAEEHTVGVGAIEGLRSKWLEHFTEVRAYFRTTIAISLYPGKEQQTEEEWEEAGRVWRAIYWNWQRRPFTPAGLARMAARLD